MYLHLFKATLHLCSASVTLFFSDLHIIWPLEPFKSPLKNTQQLEHRESSLVWKFIISSKKTHTVYKRSLFWLFTNILWCLIAVLLFYVGYQSLEARGMLIKNTNKQLFLLRLRSQPFPDPLPAVLSIHFECETLHFEIWCLWRAMPAILAC